MSKSVRQQSGVDREVSFGVPKFTGRSGKNWSATPNLPETHYVTTRLFTDPEIFKEEIENIWNKVWTPVCHESELPLPLDFRTGALAGNQPIVMVRGEDNKIRTFLNVCPHRNNIIMRSPAGTLTIGDPSGNPNHMTCMYHGWQFNARGQCVEIPRENAGYHGKICKAGSSLRELKTEVGYGGFVWVNLVDDCEPLSEFIGAALDQMLEQLETEPLEIFHYQKGVVRCNYKLFFDTSREFYHDYLHYHNRQTSMIKPGYFDQEYTQYPNGHSVTGFTTVDYSSHGGETRLLTFPGLPKNGWRHTTLFPAHAYNIRTSCLRVNIITPLSDRETLVEIRGLGLKRDTPQEREQRVKDYISVWGPFGWNLHEDLLCAQAQTQAIQQGSGAVWNVMAREEDNKVHDEIGNRAYYAEWARRMGRSTTTGEKI